MHGHQLVLNHRHAASNRDESLANTSESIGAPSHRQAPSDVSLVARCLAGDEAAWSLLIDRYKRLIYSIPFKYGLSSDEARDIFQSVCLDLVSELSRLRKPEALKGWLTSVTMHKALRLKRGHRRTDRLSTEEALVEVVPDDTPSAASVLEAAQREQAVRAAVASLPDRCQELVRLLFFSDPPLPYAQVAARLGLAVGSIGFIRGRCLKKLDAALRARGV